MRAAIGVSAPSADITKSRRCGSSTRTIFSGVRSSLTQLRGDVVASAGGAAPAAGSGGGPLARPQPAISTVASAALRIELRELPTPWRVLIDVGDAGKEAGAPLRHHRRQVPLIPDHAVVAG